MKKKYKVNPPTEIELEFKDKYKLNLIFDARALYHLTTDFTVNELTNPSTPEFCAKVIYSSTVSDNEDMTIEKARELVCQMDLENINNIVFEYQEASGASKNEQMKELQKKTMENFIMNLSRKK